MEEGTEHLEPSSGAAFRAWFKGSKVIDEADHPVEVYHGTPNGDFDQFDIAKADEDAFQCIWFSENEGQALVYALDQKKRPRSIRPVVEVLRQQRPELVAELAAFEQTIRLITYPDGTPWESYDRMWLCAHAHLFDYQAALRNAFPGAESPRIHRAYLQAKHPYIGADETIAETLGLPDCPYDSYLSIMAPHAEWAVPSVEQIWTIDPEHPRKPSATGTTFGMAHTAARLGEGWTYDRAARLARKNALSGSAPVSSPVSAGLK